MAASQKPAHYPSLENAAVVITGGASGIGAAMVEQFALQGARVAFLDIGDESAAALIKKLSPQVANQPKFSTAT